MFTCGLTPDLSVHAADPPVGSVEVSTFPAESTAAHRFVEAQETDRRYGPWSPITDTRHAWDGSVEVMTASDKCIGSPDWPIATHSVPDGHDMAAGDIDDGFGSGSAVRKLHASGDGVSANAGTATEPDATKLATTANASTHTPRAARAGRDREPSRRGCIAPVTAAR
jgi:hypothetical protein